MPDLWPDDFGVSDVTPPVAILREQAGLLSKKTNGLILGEVRTAKDGDRFVHHLLLRAPLLDNYLYDLLTVVHPVDLYPLKVAIPGMRDGWKDAPDESTFLRRLREGLTSEETRRVIRSLLSQSVAVGPDPT